MYKKFLSVFLALLTLFLIFGRCFATEHTVTTVAQLQTILDGKAKPGDVITLAAGTYKGEFTSKLVGAVVRPQPGARAIIDGKLVIRGSNTVYRDLEITNSTTARQYGDDYKRAADVPGKSTAVIVVAPNTKLINLIVHDGTGSGIGLWQEAVNSEVYGCLIYHNGISKFGHGIYTNGYSPNPRLIADNIIWGNSGLGISIHITRNPGITLDGYRIEGNTVANNGFMYDGARNVDIGQGKPVKRLAFLNNFTYQGDASKIDTLLAYSSTKSDVTVQGNYFAGVMRVENGAPATIQSNQFVGPSAIITSRSERPVSPGVYAWNYNRYYSREDSGRPFSFPLTATPKTMSFAEWKASTRFDAQSQFNSGRPGTVDVFMRPNRYTPGRANIVVYNWLLRDFVDVNVSGVLKPGVRYEVRNAMDYFAAPVLSGTYSGQALRLPLKGLTTARLLGNAPAQPKASGEFSAFVLLSK